MYVDNFSASISRLTFFLIFKYKIKTGKNKNYHLLSNFNKTAQMHHLDIIISITSNTTNSMYQYSSQEPMNCCDIMKWAKYELSQTTLWHSSRVHYNSFDWSTLKRPIPLYLVHYQNSYNQLYLMSTLYLIKAMATSLIQNFI